MGCAGTKSVGVGVGDCFAGKPSLLTRDEMMDKKGRFHEQYDNLLNRISDYQKG